MSPYAPISKLLISRITISEILGQIARILCSHFFFAILFLLLFFVYSLATLPSFVKNGFLLKFYFLSLIILIGFIRRY